MAIFGILSVISDRVSSNINTMDTIFSFIPHHSWMLSETAFLIYVAPIIWLTGLCVDSKYQLGDTHQANTGEIKVLAIHTFYTLAMQITRISRCYWRYKLLMDYFNSL